MRQIVVMIAVLTGLSVLTGCAHMPEMSWPFGAKEPVVATPPPPPAEEIGPRVEAVPVEPVTSENLLSEEAAPVPEPFGL